MRTNIYKLDFEKKRSLATSGRAMYFPGQGKEMENV